MDEARSLVSRLASDTSIEDLQYHLYVIDKVRKGLESIENKGGLTQEQVERRLSRWYVA